MKRPSSRGRDTAFKKSLDPAQAVSAYLARQPAGARAALERLRKVIRAAAPEATEAISYQMPTLTYRGSLVAFAAHPKHCSLYLMSHAAMAAHERDLEGYDTSGVTIRFQPDQPLPESLVRKLVKTRMRENTELEASKSGRAGQKPR